MVTFAVKKQQQIKTVLTQTVSGQNKLSVSQTDHILHPSMALGM